MSLSDHHWVSADNLEAWVFLWKLNQVYSFSNSVQFFSGFQESFPRKFGDLTHQSPLDRDVSGSETIWSSQWILQNWSVPKKSYPGFIFVKTSFCVKYSVLFKFTILFSFLNSSFTVFFIILFLSNTNFRTSSADLEEKKYGWWFCELLSIFLTWHQVLHDITDHEIKVSAGSLFD